MGQSGKPVSKAFTDAVGTYLAQLKEFGNGHSFSELLEAYESRMNDHIRVGDKIKGRIVSIGADTVFMETGTKIDGAVEKAELLDANGQLPYQVGDELELYVVSMKEHEIRLSKAISGIGGLNILKEAMQNGVPVEGKVKEPCKGGFTVEMLQHKTFCPISQMDIRYVEDVYEYVGKTFLFLVSRIEENGKNIVVSRRELLIRAQEKAKAEFMETLKPDMIIDGKVANIMPFGVFVELFPGIEGMIPLSELSWARFEKPDEIVKKGDVITVKVLNIGIGEKNKPKIGLSAKQAAVNPWETEMPFGAGDKVQGKITRCTDFGVFVELAPGIEGLVHISEMSYIKRVVKPEDEVKVGDRVDVMIKEIDRERKRISLSIRDAEGDPWIRANETYKAGQKVEGKVEKKDKFGLFITLEPGITGLLPKSRIAKSQSPAVIEKLKPGDPITVLIEEVKLRERKITLGPADAAEEEDWKAYSKTQPASASLGSLGEKLQKAMNKKLQAR